MNGTRALTYIAAASSRSARQPSPTSPGACGLSENTLFG